MGILLDQIDNITQHNDIQQFFKEIIKDYLNIDKYNSRKDYEKIIIACILFSIMKNKLSVDGYLMTSLELFINANIGKAVDDLDDIETNSRSRYQVMVNYIKKNKLKFNNFHLIENIDIENILSLDNTTILRDIYSDEKFDIKLFNNNTGIVLTTNRINNLKKLYKNLLYPVLMYYKKINNITENILFISESITSDNKLQSKGMAVKFYLIGIDNDVVFNDIKNKVIDIEFGAIKLNDEDIFITIPYKAEGILIKNKIVENKFTIF